MLRKVVRLFAAVAVIFWAQAFCVWAEEPNGRDAEIQELKARLERLEEALEAAKQAPPQAPTPQTAPAGRPAAAKEPEGERTIMRCPVPGPPETEPSDWLKTVKISGAVQATGQGTVGNEPGDRTGANVSADLYLEAAPTEHGTIGLHLDMARGTGISNTPRTGFEIGRFGSTLLGGPNADLEWNSDIPHLIEAWYEHSLLDDKLVATFGILDPTIYFDANSYANCEKFQFLADTFVNNPGIDWGGDANFYGPGLRLTASPVDWLDVSLGGFATHTVSSTDDDEVVGFENEFDQPFAIAEVDFKLAPLRREGNYRFYVWYNANKDLFTDFQTGEHKASWGGGGSFDQTLAENLGAFLRWSKQDGSIRQIEWHVSGGLSAVGLIPGRPYDVAAVGYAVGWISDEFRRSADSGSTKGTEQWLEAYYNLAFTPNLFFTPDFQYVINPGGEDEDIFIWGFRALAVF